MRRTSGRRSLAFMAGPSERFAALAAVLDRAKPGRQWDFICANPPDTVPAGARVLPARRSIGFALRLWTRAWIRPYQSVCIAGRDLDRADAGWVSTIASALPADDHVIVDSRGGTAALRPFGLADLFSMVATACLLVAARTVTRMGLLLPPAGGPPRPRGRQVAVLVPVLPDLSHTFVYREVLELKRRHPEYLVIALERGDGSVVHAEAAKLLALSEAMPKARRNGYLLQYLGYWLRRPRTTARVIRTTAPHASSIARGRAGDVQCLTRLEYLNHPDHAMAGVALARYLERRGVGYAHVYGATFPSVRAVVAQGLMGLRFSVSTFVDFDYPTPFHMLREKVSAASFVVGCTAYCADRLRRQFPFLDGRLFVVRHSLPKDYADGKVLRRRDGCSRLVYVGRFVPKKGLDTLLEACRLLKAAGVPFSCHLYGNGPMREHMERFVSAAGLGGVVVFEGEVANEDFFGTMNADDVFVCPSRLMADGERDGIPVSMMEAMAGGITVVSTSVSGIPELVRHGDNGYLVPPDDPAALADTLGQLLTTPALRSAVSARAVTTIQEGFTVDGAMDQLDGLIAGAR